jgi:hypothetical protein
MHLDLGMTRLSLQIVLFIPLHVQHNLNFAYPYVSFFYIFMTTSQVDQQQSSKS